jgi:hypothetical protein
MYVCIYIYVYIYVYIYIYVCIGTEDWASASSSLSSTPEKRKAPRVKIGSNIGENSLPEGWEMLLSTTGQVCLFFFLDKTVGGLTARRLGDAASTATSTATS